MLLCAGRNLGRQRRSPLLLIVTRVRRERYPDQADATIVGWTGLPASLARPDLWPTRRPGINHSPAAMTSLRGRCETRPNFSAGRPCDSASSTCASVPPMPLATSATMWPSPRCSRRPCRYARATSVLRSEPLLNCPMCGISEARPTRMSKALTWVSGHSLPRRWPRTGEFRDDLFRP